jgi:hypothetical protein
MGVKLGKSTDQLPESSVLRISGPKMDYIIGGWNFVRSSIT